MYRAALLISLCAMTLAFTLLLIIELRARRRQAQQRGIAQVQVDS